MNPITDELMPDVEWGGWAISEDLAVLLIGRFHTSRPKVVLEFGSGLSTALMATLLDEYDCGHLFSFEHDAHYLARTQAELERRGLTHRVTLNHTPLSAVPGEDYRWYDIKDEMLPNDIDLVLVDGPPKRDGSRLPALPLIASRMAENSMLVMDDANRDEGLQIIAAWSQLPGFRHKVLRNTVKGTALFWKISSKEAPGA